MQFTVYLYNILLDGKPDCYARGAILELGSGKRESERASERRRPLLPPSVPPSPSPLSLSLRGGQEGKAAKEGRRLQPVVGLLYVLTLL